MSATIPADHKEQSNDSMICYCHGLTHDNLVKCHDRLGGLPAVQAETGAGNACGGCRIILQSLFNETPVEINDVEGHQAIDGATVCQKPGSRIMKGFLIHDSHLHSIIKSSNASPPQFSDCDSTMPIEYAVHDHEGRPVLHRRDVIRTNETFVFDTRKENLPKPFYGTFTYQLGRSNYGAARFNVYWSNGRSTTTTHEISISGRPDVVLPIVVDRDFLAGPNTVHLAVLNTHGIPVPYFFRAFDVDDHQEMSWNSVIPAFGTRWFNVNEHFYKPMIGKKPGAKIALRIHSVNIDSRVPPTLYFFVHNRTTDLWSTNHL